MSDDRDFVNGMIVKKPNSNAPEWVKAKMSIKLDDFKGWIGGFVKANPDDEWINIDIKESQKGTWYAERDTWKPEKKDLNPQPRKLMTFLGNINRRCRTPVRPLCPVPFSGAFFEVKPCLTNTFIGANWAICSKPTPHPS